MLRFCPSTRHSKRGRASNSHCMQVPSGANPAEIKAAYRQLQKLCHPDILGAEHGHDASILLNQVCSSSFQCRCIAAHARMCIVLNFAPAYRATFHGL